MAAGVIGYIGRLRLAEGDDADLLRAYARERDADAFAALVRRHGGRVWATCRRVAGDPHAAEDAFQATFLVLARRAAVLDPAIPVGGWLHAVAVNVSVRARTAADRRKRREVAEVDAAAPTPPGPPDERALAALDEEIERLPAKLRDAVVLCELDGLSRKDAAARLGVPEGTLSSRLAAARKRLAERLKGRGVRPELLAVPAAVPAGLVAAACGPPSAAVLALTGGTMRALLLKGLAAGVLALGLVAVGGRAEEPPRPAAAAAAKPAGPDTITVREGNQYVVLSPDGKRVRDEPIVTRSMAIRVSPDGKLAAFAELSDPPTDDLGHQRATVQVFPTGRKDEPQTFAVNAGGLFWGADGKSLIATEMTPGSEPTDRGFVSYRIIPGTPPAKRPDEPERRPFPGASVKPLAHPREFRPIAELPGDGFIGYWWSEGMTVIHLARWAKPGAAPQLLTQVQEGGEARLSADGRRVLFVDRDPADPLPPAGHFPPRRLWLFDLTTGKRTRLPGVPADAVLTAVCWAPDGNRVAYTWKRFDPNASYALSVETITDPRHKTPVDAFLTVMDADGRNRRDIRTAKGDPGSTVNLADLDWR